MNPNAPPRIAVFGAGIAGLTAAHELAERGFRVRVYEPAPPGPDEKICGIGGMARTQYGRVSLQYESLFPPDRPVMVGTRKVPPELDRLRRCRIDFEVGSKQLDAAAKKTLRTEVMPILRALPLEVRVRGHTDAAEARPDPLFFFGAEPARGLDAERALSVIKFLVDEGAARRTRGPEDKASKRSVLFPTAMGFGYPQELTRSPAERCYVDFAVDEDLLPGEHGFRFFPSFYRHVFDTMKRIPIAERTGPFLETALTVYDHLVPTVEQGIAYRGSRPFTVKRRPETSFQELSDAIVVSLERSGITLADAAHLQRRILRYMTSCTRRRVTEFENLSWWDFLEVDRCSPRCQELIERSPQMLVAMRAKVCDARTMGNIVVQLLTDQLVNTGRTDQTLRGPTTSAWLIPWRRYLERQGVEFERGRLAEILEVDSRVVTIVERLGDAAPSPGLSRGGKRLALDWDYYVVALPAEAARAVVRSARRLTTARGARPRLGHPLRECPHCAKIADLPLGRPDRARPGGLSEHMSGIQYFFGEPIDFISGHIILPDTDWGLSLIAQPQFWRSRRGWWDGYRSIVSVDIGDWNRKSTGAHGQPTKRGKTAWESTADQIAHEVWRQIAEALGLSSGKMVPPMPLFYHIDEHIRFDPKRGTPLRNEAPMLINRVGTYEQRPGSPDPSNGGWYHLHGKRLVFCGTFMQTATRLTTMESANESARRAVNAILADVNYGLPCAVWDPETCEPPDLKPLKEIDERVFRAESGLSTGGSRVRAERDLEKTGRRVRRGRNLADAAPPRGAGGDARHGSDMDLDREPRRRLRRAGAARGRR